MTFGFNKRVQYVTLPSKQCSICRRSFLATKIMRFNTVGLCLGDFLKGKVHVNNPQTIPEFETEI